MQHILQSDIYPTFIQNKYPFIIYRWVAHSLIISETKLYSPTAVYKHIEYRNPIFP